MEWLVQRHYRVSLWDQVWSVVEEGAALVDCIIDNVVVRIKDNLRECGRKEGGRG